MVSVARAEIVVDLDAIEANVRRLAAAAGPARLMVVVKADGYGHGMVPVARAARRAGAPWLGAAVLEEALALREAGDTGRILTWLTVPGEDVRAGVRAGLDLTAYSVAEVEHVRAAARDTGVRARLQLKIDTGLHRGGATETAWPAVVQAALDAQRSGEVEVTGMWSHLACADEPDHPANGAQEGVFARAVSVAEDAGLRFEVRHLANSAATLVRPSAHWDLVRCGIAAYGLTPDPVLGTATELGLRQAMTVRSHLVLVKPVAAGEAVSYGHTWRAPRDTVVGLVPLGYGDGIPRHASSGPDGRGAEVLVGGRRAPVRGRICMDQFVVELGHPADGGIPARAGDPVTLLGSADGAPSAQDWADAAGTIGYEIVTRMRGRQQRRYVGAHAEEDTR